MFWSRVWLPWRVGALWGGASPLHGRVWRGGGAVAAASVPVTVGDAVVVARVLVTVGNAVAIASVAVTVESDVTVEVGVKVGRGVPTVGVKVGNAFAATLGVAPCATAQFNTCSR